MALKQCEQCSEMVDEAKAFCPECGHAMVVETKREVASNFDTFEGTIKLGDTMYNQMLTDMGLNISRAPNTSERRVEVIAPAAVTEKPVEKSVPARPAAVSYMKWWILGGVVAALALLVMIAAILVLIFWSRIT